MFKELGSLINKEEDIKKEEKQGENKENKDILVKNQFYILDLA
jgi:hypothetical protein